MNRKRITLVIATALVAIGGTTLATAASQATGTTDPVWTAIERARAATAKYHDVHQALRAGYARVSPCVEAPDGSGAMGLHYLNAAYAKDPAIRADRPELLLYFPRANGTLRLVGVEYWRPDADQNLTTDGDRPSLAGIPFQGPMEGHDPEMPKHYDLHAWVWKYNPAGTFAQFNTALHC
jgi:hypothetical protein